MTNDGTAARQSAWASLCSPLYLSATLIAQWSAGSSMRPRDGAPAICAVCCVLSTDPHMPNSGFVLSRVRVCACAVCAALLLTRAAREAALPRRQSLPNILVCAASARCMLRVGLADVGPASCAVRSSAAAVQHGQCTPNFPTLGCSGLRYHHSGYPPPNAQRRNSCSQYVVRSLWCHSSAGDMDPCYEGNLSCAFVHGVLEEF